MVNDLNAMSVASRSCKDAILQDTSTFIGVLNLIGAIFVEKVT